MKRLASLVVVIWLLLPGSTWADSLTNGLVAYWQFEAAGGQNQSDASGNNHTLTQAGSPTQEATHKGGSWSAGIGSSKRYSNSDAAIETTASFSVDGWIYSTTTDVSNGIWDRWGTKFVWALYSDVSGHLKFLMRQNDCTTQVIITSAVAINTSGWANFAFGLDTTNQVIWLQVNNETRVTGSFTTAMCGDSEPMQNGLGGAPPALFIDDTAFWGRVLTAADVEHIYTNDMASLLLPPPTGCTNGSFTYTSSIDPSYNNLYAVFSYPTNGPGTTNLPIICVLHPFTFDTNTGGATNISVPQRETMATNYPVFVVAPGMRGRDGAKGLPDGSAREIYDIRDCIEFVKNNYSAVAATTNITVIGYSGGGANALNFACKFPDYANQIVDYFGISDYGSNNASYADAVWGTNAPGHGWGYQIPSEWSYLAGAGPAFVAQIGSRTNFPNAYFCRAAVYACATNLQGGHLWNYHQNVDTTVWYDQSIQITNSFNALGNTRITARHHASLYDHRLPDAAEATPWLPDSYDDWLSGATNATYATWTFPASGYCRVMGYLVTKRFTIWLDNSGDTARIGGTNQVADVTYSAGSYTVTPLTGTIQVSITEGSCSVTNTISSATTISMCSASGSAYLYGGKLIKAVSGL